VDGAEGLQKLQQDRFSAIISDVEMPNLSGIAMTEQIRASHLDIPIVGHGRGDIFWGRGATAELRAGLMKQPGQLWLLVAKKSALVGINVSQAAVSLPIVSD